MVEDMVIEAEIRIRVPKNVAEVIAKAIEPEVKDDPNVEVRVAEDHLYLHFKAISLSRLRALINSYLSQVTTSYNAVRVASGEQVG